MHIALPFPSMMNTTVEVWLGVKTGAEVWTALAAQLGWALLLFGVAALVLSRGLRRLEVAGG